MLKLENISVTFNDAKALNHFCAQAHKGDFIIIVGPNGAGKSTLLETLSGSAKPQEGSLFLENTNMTSLSELERASMISKVHQNPSRSMVAEMTVEENLAIACYKGKKVSFQNAFKQWHTINTDYKSVFNPALLTQKVGELSGGQRQRLAFVMATLQPSPLLLLDEPTAALDTKSAEQMLQDIKAYVEKYQSITLLITHNLEDALAMGNKIWIIKKGKLVQEIEAEEKKYLSYEALKQLM